MELQDWVTSQLDKALVTPSNYCEPQNGVLDLERTEMAPIPFQGQFVVLVHCRSLNIYTVCSLPIVHCSHKIF